MNIQRYDKEEVLGTFLIYSNTNVTLARNTVLTASEDINDYYTDDSIFRDNCGNELGRSMFFAKDASNIEICGEEGAVIDGNGSAWIGEKAFQRPCLIRLINCKNITIKDIKLINSPSWCVHLHNCENVTINNVQIISKCNMNNDGFDIDCCRDVSITNCSIDSGDDAVVLKSTKDIESRNIRIENCVIRTRWSGFKIGTESVGDFKDVFFTKNKILCAEGCAIKIVPVDGSNVENIQISDVLIFESTGPIFIANGSRMRKYYPDAGDKQPGRIKNILFENIIANVGIKEEGDMRYGRGVILISGTKENMIEGIKMRNCFFAMPCGYSTSADDLFVAELTTQYPEYYTLGTTPAYGLFLRNLKKAVFQNVVIYKKNDDTRKEIIAENVEDVIIK